MLSLGINFLTQHLACGRIYANFLNVGLNREKSVINILIIEMLSIKLIKPMLAKNEKYNIRRQYMQI